MSGNENILYIKLDNGNFGYNSLDGFVFRQKVSRCWRKNGAVYVLTPVNYTEDRTLTERRQTAKKITDAVNSGSTAVGAFKDGEVIGFALLADRLSGGKNKYADLLEFYVSEPFRNRGVGRKLFSFVCAEARKSGAKKLYISAHSAEETIRAYDSYGCILASEPSAEHIKKEPFDLQTEISLTEKFYSVADKRKYFPLLLIADEQADMVERYIEAVDFYVVDDGGVKGGICVLDAGDGVLEIKNLAVYPQYRRQGYGRKLIDFVCCKYGRGFTHVTVGTGDSPLTAPFYEKCGFVRTHTVKNFFTDNYDRPIIEAGVRLKDMVYLKKSIGK